MIAVDTAELRLQRVRASRYRLQAADTLNVRATDTFSVAAIAAIDIATFSVNLILATETGNYSSIERVSTEYLLHFFFVVSQFSPVFVFGNEKSRVCKPDPVFHFPQAKAN